MKNIKGLPFETQRYEIRYKQNKIIKLSELDIHNLFDTLYIAEEGEGFYENLKLNNLFNWYKTFTRKLEEYVCPELKKEKKKDDK